MGRIASAKNLLQVCKDYFKRLVAADAATGAVNAHLELVIPIAIPDAATGDVDYTADDAFEVVGFECLKRNGAGAGNTCTLKKGATAISDAVACAVDNALTRAASIDDADGVNVFAKGDTLRISATRAAGTRDSLCLVRVIMR